MTARLYRAHDVNEMYPLLKDELMSLGVEARPRGTVTREIHPVMVEIERPLYPLVSSYGRPVNVTFALAELLWILLGLKEVKMLQFYNSNIAQFSDNGDDFNAAYGYRMRKGFGHDQIEDVIQLLTADPESRQGVISIFDPRYDRAFWGPYDKNLTKDRACNIVANLLIRDGKLDWTQTIRSNDLIFGMPYNFMQWMNIQAYCAIRLGVGVGSFYDQINSLHVYTDNGYYDEGSLAAIKPFDIYTEFKECKLPYNHHPVILTENHAVLEDLEYEIRTTGTWPQKKVANRWIPELWRDFFRMEYAHQWYLDHNDPKAAEHLAKVSDNVYAAAQMRFYWHKRWQRIDVSVQNQVRGIISDRFGNCDAVFNWITSGA